MDKRLLIFVAIIVAAIVGAVVFSKVQPNPNVISAEQRDLFDVTKVIDERSLPEGFNNDGKTPATTASNTYDHWSGNRDAKVVFVEYGDFACSHCAQYNPILEVARQTYGDKVAFVYRNYLLGGVYVNSTAAAATAEAAAFQDKFWEMHNILFENQNNWYYADTTSRKDIFKMYAEQIDLDLARWERDYDDYQTNGIKTRIDFQMSLISDKYDVKGTPTIIVNGHQLDTEANPEDKWTTQEDLNALLERYIQESETTNDATDDKAE